jgi:Holliday junction resolvase
MLITKADGTEEDFDQSKLVASLKRSGAEVSVAQQVAEEITRGLYRGITTGEIYRRAFARLRETRRGLAARYSLKRAILDFGPSGFPFEVYIAEMLRAEGYETTVDQLVPGSCVEHEVDVVATRGGETLYVEAKFHNSPGYKTDLKTVLYVQARMEDIGKGTGLVVTNTKFTSVAVEYARCKGLGVLGWEQPADKTLQDRIEAAKVFPITALTTLTGRQKTALLAKKVVLCNDLGQHAQMLLQAGVPASKTTAVLEEADSLCAAGAGV